MMRWAARMQESDGRKIAIYIVLVAASVSLLISLVELLGPHHPPVDAIFRQIGSPAGLILLALSMLTRPKVVSRYFMFASAAILVAVIVLHVRHLLVQ